MKRYKDHSVVPYPVYSAKVDSLDELEQLEFPSMHFVLLLAADFSKFHNSQMTDIASVLIQKGLLHVYTTGPMCDIAHVNFDIITIIHQVNEKSDLNVYSDECESLEEALWMALFTSVHEDADRENCSIVVVSIGDEDSYRIINDCLSDIDKFNDRMVEDEQ